MIRHFTLLLFLCFGPLITFSQNDHHDHDHFRNEIGGALGVVYSISEQHTGSGFHFHYTRMFGGKLSHFGIAPGLEFIMGEDKHYTAHVMALYRPLFGWWLAVGPGLSYFEHDYSMGFSAHFETGYEFDAGSIHFGPVLEYSWSEEDQHALLGIHLGIPF